MIVIRNDSQAAYLRGADDTVKVSHTKVREAKAVVEDLQKGRIPGSYAKGPGSIPG